MKLRSLWPVQAAIGVTNKALRHMEKHRTVVFSYIDRVADGLCVDVQPEMPPPLMEPSRNPNDKKSKREGCVKGRLRFPIADSRLSIDRRAQ